MRFYFIITYLLFALSSKVNAQAPERRAAENIAEGDRALSALHPDSALMFYEAVLAKDSLHPEALWKASQAAIIWGEFTPKITKPSGEIVDTLQPALYAKGEKYARRAVERASKNENAHFALAYALGRIALTKVMGPARLPYAQEVYAHVRQCLALSPQKAECLGILGAWNAEVMRVPVGMRLVAKTMGAKELNDASVEKGERYLQQALKLQPNRTIYLYELGRLYFDADDTSRARAQLQAAVDAPVKDYNDPSYKGAAKRLLRELEKSVPITKLEAPYQERFRADERTLNRGLSGCHIQPMIDTLAFLSTLT